MLSVRGSQSLTKPFTLTMSIATDQQDLFEALFALMTTLESLDVSSPTNGLKLLQTISEIHLQRALWEEK